MHFSILTLPITKNKTRKSQERVENFKNVSLKWTCLFYYGKETYVLNGYAQLHVNYFTLKVLHVNQTSASMAGFASGFGYSLIRFSYTFHCFSLKCRNYNITEYCTANA